MNEELCGYVCFFNNKRWECHAKSRHEAQYMAIEYFKPANNKRHMISVVLAERPDGSKVTHKPLF